jgi:hypothetical protein
MTWGTNDAPFDPQAVPAQNETWGKMDPSMPKAPTAAGRAVDMALTPFNWARTQFTKAATSVMGAPRAIADTNEAVATWAGDKLGFPETGRTVGKALRWVNPNPVLANVGPTSAADFNQTVFGTLGVPEVNAGDNPALTVGGVNLGKMADVGMQAVPFAAAGAGGILPNFLGGVTSEAAGQATEGTPYEIPARMLGALPGSLVGARITTPLPANLTPQQARAVELAKANGVPLSVGQETGRGLGVERFLSRMPGGQGISERLAAKQGAVTDEIALAQAGFKGNELGQITMGEVAKKAGAEFEAAKNMPGVIDLNPTFPKVRDVVAKYEGVMDPAKRSPAVATEAGRILSKEPVTRPTYQPLTATAVEPATPTLANLTTAVRNAGKSVDEAFDALPSSKMKDWFNKPMAPMPKELPELSSVQYQTLRRGLTDAVDGLYKAGDSNGAMALKAMRTALDDAVEGSLGGDKLAKWQEARKHYYNFKILQKAMNNAPASARSEGTLGTNALTGALKRAQGDKFYETTGGLNDVATIKGYLRDTFPNSGTPTIGAQLAAVANPFLGGSLWAGNNLASRAMLGGGPMSGLVRNYLANQAMPNTIPSGLQGLPAGVAPGILSDQQRLRLMDRRGQ